MYRGLPASGKSTHAREFVLSQPNGSWKIVNKDSLRAMLDAGRWSKKNEEFVIDARNWLVMRQLENGLNVIVDDTNFNPAHEQKLRMIAEDFKADFEIKDFECDVYECIERDAKRLNGVGKDVIWDMWKKFVIPKVVWPENRNTLPDAVICDLDGTLAADISHRSPYDASTCEQDKPNLMLASMLQSTGMQILFVSGREDKYRPQTTRWLDTLFNGTITYSLWMRPDGDNRKDWLIKYEILRDVIVPSYNPRIIFDDRDQVVAMWRAQGLRVFQVADGNF